MEGITPTEAVPFFTKHNIVDPTKGHLALCMIFGYYDDNVERTSFPRLRITKDEFVTIF